MEGMTICYSFSNTLIIMCENCITYDYCFILINSRDCVKMFINSNNLITLFILWSLFHINWLINE
jgi:hypothetical protein